MKKKYLNNYLLYLNNYLFNINFKLFKFILKSRI